MKSAIQIKKLAKVFTGRKVVFKDFDLDIEKNKIYGLLGRNGSGKTTLLKIISNLYVKTSGEVIVFGEEAFENEKILSKICFIGESNNFIESFTPKQIFDITAAYYDNWNEELLKELIDKFNLDINKTYSKLSRGMQAAVNIIVGLVSRAEITIYDEAYLGLDAVGRELFYRELLKDYSKYKRTIIFSTHYIEEVSKLFEKLIIIDNGKLIVNEDVDTLRNNAFYISGEKKRLESEIRNLNVISREEIGSVLKVGILQNIDEEKIYELQNENFNVESMAIQELFINLSLGNAN